MHSTSSLISVVMSVYNGEDTLSITLDSILSQEGVDLEFIVVNDGSTDDTLQILDKYAGKDKRLKVLNQENQGLTCSLIRGCAEAEGEFIARQDAGDTSLSSRLYKQQSFLIENPDVVLVSCGTRFIGPTGEKLYEVIQSEESASKGLHLFTIENIRGPSHHGSTMFRKKDYQAVGGYRAQFQVAQDLDLWTRLVEQGRHCAIQDVLYQACIARYAISIRKRNQQINTTKLILECTLRRRSGQSEETILEQASKNQSHLAGADYSRIRDSGFYYFLGCCLRNSDPEKAKNYFTLALKSNPLHLKALFRYLNTR